MVNIFFPMVTNTVGTSRMTNFMEKALKLSMGTNI